MKFRKKAIWQKTRQINWSLENKFNLTQKLAKLVEFIKQSRFDVKIRESN